MRKRCTCADRTGLTSPTLRHGSKVNHPRRPAVLRRGAREPFEPRCHGEHARALQTAGHASLLRYHGGSDRNTPWSRQRHPVREPPAPAARSKAFGSANSFLYSTAALLPCVRATNSRARGAGTTLECTDSFGTGNGQQDDKSVMFEPVRRRVDAPSLMWTEKSSRPPPAVKLHPCRRELPHGRHSGWRTGQAGRFDSPRAPTISLPSNGHAKPGLTILLW